MSLAVGLLILISFCRNIKVLGQEDELFNKHLQDAYGHGLDLFSGLDKVLKYLRENETTPLSRKILETFETECMYIAESEIPEGKIKKPFIVIEGNHRPSKEVIAIRLAKLTGGRSMIHPAPCLAKFLDVLPKGTLLRRAYYMLSMYAQALNAKVHMSLGRTVILNGYWVEQLVFHLIQSFPSGPLPPTTSDIFKLPDGLLKPDLIIYLNFPDSLKIKGMTTKSPIVWKPRALNIYKELSNRLPIRVETLTGQYRTTLQSTYNYVLNTLSETHDVFGVRRTHVDWDAVARSGVVRGVRSNTTAQ